MTNCPCDEPPDVERDIARALNSIAAGQSALPRQVRSFPEVREALLASLPRPENEALQLWRARNSRDLGLMLLEMWAYVSDVLAFYDERIANESYLRTAQRPISLRRLVELLGYIPAPGVAGSVTLAALAEGRRPVQLPAGTAFRSDAFGDQPPQVFEITTPTTIHPFKNEWTIGPVRNTSLPQPTPTQVEAQQRGQSPTSGEFFVFETLEFGLAVDRLVLVTAPYFPSQPSKVTAIRPFAAKDGRTYAEVRFDPPIKLEDVFVTIDANLVKVRVPTVSFPSPATVTVYQALERTLDGEVFVLLPVEAVRRASSTAINVYLDSVYRQLRVGDSLIVLTPDGAQHGTAEFVEERLVEVQPAPNDTVPPTRVPVTFVTIGSVQYSSLPDREDFSFHFSFVDGGRVTTVAETELTPQQLANSFLPVQGIVDRPPDATSSGSLDQKFLLTDPDSNGAEVDGRMLFGASGRAQFDIFADLSAVPSPLPADRYKTPLTVYGNVITATRGESVFNEVLGSGDPRIPGQQFTLKKKPLTYVSAPNALGRTSTLQLFCCPPSQVLGRGRPARLRSLPNPCSARFARLRADGRDARRRARECTLQRSRRAIRGLDKRTCTLRHEADDTRMSVLGDGALGARVQPDDSVWVRSTVVERHHRGQIVSARLAQLSALPSRRGKRRRSRKRTTGFAHVEPQLFAPALHVGQSVSAPPSFAPEIARQRSQGGESLPSPLVDRFAHTFGSPARTARVHTTPESNLLALGVGAQAFTLGRDIFFKPHAYRPDLSSGQRLIAHELSHVVQQGAGLFPSQERIARQPDSKGAILQGAIGFGAQLLGSGLEAMADRAALQLADNPLAQSINALRAELRNARDPIELPVPAVRRLIEIVESLRGHLPVLLPVPNLAPTIQAVAMVPAAGAVAIPLGLILAVLALILIAALLIAAVVHTLAPGIEELVRSLRGAGRPAPAPLPAPAPPVARPVPPPPVTAPRVEPKADPTAKPVPVPVPIPRELDRNRRRTACDIRPLGFHLGGSVRHNMCADLKPPNVFPGSDAHVTTPSKRTKNFDALSPAGELWEVKTGDPHESKSRYLFQLRLDIAEIRSEKSIADECGRPYVFAVSDPVRFSLLKGRVPNVAFRLVDC